MKTFGVIILFGILFSCGNRSEKKDQKINESEDRIATRIKVKKIDFLIVAVIPIDCDEFDRITNLSYIIEDKDMIDQYMNIIGKLKKDTINNYPLDTRAKLYIHYQNNQIDTICMSRGQLSINGQYFYNDEILVEMIEKL